MRGVLTVKETESGVKWERRDRFSHGCERIRSAPDLYLKSSRSGYKWVEVASSQVLALIAVKATGRLGDAANCPTSCWIISRRGEGAARKLPIRGRWLIVQEGIAQLVFPFAFLDS